jgi:spermidine synthase
VLCIALGSFAVSLLPRIPPSLLLINQTALVVLLVGIYGLMPRAPYEAHVLRTVFSLQDVAFYPYYLAAFASLLLLTGLPVVLSGATLPLLFHALRRERGDLGGVAGRLYSWNTVGSLLGALLGGYALLFWLDLHHVYRIALAALLLGALILAVLRVGARNAWIAVAAALPLSAALYRLPAWSPKAFATGAYRARTAGSLSYAGAEAFYRGWWRGRKLLFYQDGPTLSAAILEQRLPDEESFRALLVNGKPDGATAVDSITMGLLGVLPALFVDPVERAFVIGYGTGVTAGELAALDSTREVVVAEISSAVLEGAPLFDFANGGVTQNPKVRLVRSDAYRALMRDPRRFDVIASAPSNPWVTGVEMLYSREFLEAARRRLTPRGVYIQFFQQYEIDSPTVALVLRTYADVFDHVAVWYGSGPDLLLLGFNDPTAALDVGRLEQRAAQPDIAAGLRRAGIESFPALITHELLPLGVVRALALEGPIHTLYDPILNHRAARAYFRGENARLPFSGFDGPAQVGAEHSLLQRYARRFGGALPEARRRESVMEACRHRARQCTTLLAAWEREHGDTPALRRTREAAAATNFRRFGGSVDAATARELIGLFPAADGKPPEADSPEALARDTSRFAAFYAHAAPFDPERLLRRWERCEARPETSDACGAGLARARALLRSEGSSIHTAVAETVP